MFQLTCFGLLHGDSSELTTRGEVLKYAILFIALYIHEHSRLSFVRPPPAKDHLQYRSRVQCTCLCLATDTPNLLLSTDISNLLLATDPLATDPK